MAQQNSVENTHFLKKECGVSMLLEPEFTRPHDSRKIFSELVHSGQNNAILHRKLVLYEWYVVMPMVV